MKNTVKVTIDGRDYNMVAAEDEAYVRRCAELVDRQVREISAGGRLSQTDAAVLAAMNVADMLLKEQEASENLRRQVKESLEEANALKMELSEAKRQIFKLGTKK